MRRAMLAVITLSSYVSAIAQNVSPDEALLSKTRALYDAPFSRGLISFDCAVKFDWKEHFVAVLGSFPTAAGPTIARLQSLQHRVFVDRSGAVVSVTPSAPAVTDEGHAAELERTLNSMVSGGLNAWLPFSANVILPVAPTKFNFQATDSGYKVPMSGPGVEATLLLAPDLRLRSGVSHLPQPMRFETEFVTGPDGYLLSSVKTGSTTDSAMAEATFTYKYQAVQGFQLPSAVTVNPSHSELWNYDLIDCRSVSGTSINGLTKH